MPKSALEVVSVEFARLLQPLEEKLDSANFVQFMAELGWKWPQNVVVDFGNIVTHINDMVTAVGAIDLNSPFDEQIAKYTALFDSIKNLVSSINNIISTFPTPLPDSIPAEFTSKIGKQVFDYLVCAYLQRYHPILFNSLVFPGIIETEEFPFSENLPSYRAYTIQWENAAKTIGNFIQRLRDIYGWDSDNSEFNGQLFLDNLEEIMLAAGIPTGQYNIHPVLAEKLYFDAGQPVNAEVWVLNKELRIPIYEVADPGIGYSEAGFSVLAIPDKTNADKKLKGFAIAPYLEGKIDDLNFDLTENLRLAISGAIKTGIAITVLPNKIAIDEDICGPGSAFDGRFMIELSHKSSEGKIIVLGKPGKSRFEYERLAARLKLNTIGNEQDLIIETDLSGASVVIQASDGDGFIQKILPQDPVRLDFDFIMGLSRRKGIYFKLGAGLEFSIQINKSFGPFFVNTVDLEFDGNGNGIKLIAAASGGAEIGPVTTVVQKIGLETILEFGKPGLLGNADLSLGFKSPNAIGLEIDAEGITGGGFLDIDKPNYAGVLQLSFEDEIAFTAFGLITTKLPDGKDGFSLVISISAEFQPIQLGLGFALTGVGGLIGINRQMSEEALRAAVKNHSLDDIFFSESPIKDAVKIIESIKAIFPPKEGSHVFGPMVRMIWGGVITLVEFQIGIFIEIGGPGKIAIFGQAKSELPDKKLALLLFNMDVLGFIDFGNETAAIDASLFNSSLIEIRLSGDMALRTSWGDHPDFALSVGGFHPRFTPPPGFPPMRRLMMSLGSGSARLSFKTYMAITTNSFQIGALLELYVKAAGFILSGGMGFDVLFIFSPFSFDVFIRAWVSLKYDDTELFCIALAFNLSGPNPFDAKGKAKFKILFFSITPRFHVTFGKKVPEPLLVVSPLAVLIGQLRDEHNIRFSLPDWASTNLIFTEEAQTRLDPVGEIVISQSAVPLKFPMAKFGAGVPPEDEKELAITAGHEEIEINVKTSFAPEQFKKMSDDERVSGPSFEQFISGIRFGGDFATTSKDKLKTIEIAFETVLRESEDYLSRPNVPEEKKKPYRLLIEKFALAADSRGAQLLGAWSLSGSGNYFNSLRKVKDRNNPSFIQVVEPSFSVTGQGAIDGKFTRKTFNNEPVGNMTYAEALDVVKSSEDKDAMIRDTVFVAAKK